jgi:ATP-dependent RNA helicase RhlE
MQFDQLSLSEPILRAVRAAGYETTTPIQAQAIPSALAGRDVLGCAQTGTGKTAAFSLPILERLASQRPGGRAIRALVVTPTRELAAQIGESLQTYGKHLSLRGAVIFGGVTQARQVDALRRGVDVLVATPGRLLDLIDQRHVRLDAVEILVLDEADRMLDMGFIRDVRAIVARVPAKRQTLLFSATMPPEIQSLADSMLVDPVKVSVAPQATTAEKVDQHVYMVAREDKQALLTHLLQDRAMTRTLVFTRTKHGADRVAKRLERSRIPAAAIHGNKSQNARLRALDDFKRGRTRVLIASDLAARGLDIDDVSHVINFDLPNEPETYVHRIGRTARAGASGIALSFCAAEEREYLRDIERIIRAEVPIVTDHPFDAGHGKLAARAPAGARAPRPAGSGRPAAAPSSRRRRRPPRRRAS